MGNSKSTEAPPAKFPNKYRVENDTYKGPSSTSGRVSNAGFENPQPVQYIAPRTSWASPPSTLTLQYYPHEIIPPGYSSSELRLIGATASKARAESARSQAESARSQAESPRSQAESPRSQAESPRSEAESPRSQAESPRSQAESPRSQAESPRSHHEPILDKIPSAKLPNDEHPLDNVPEFSIPKAEELHRATNYTSMNSTTTTVAPKVSQAQDSRIYQYSSEELRLIRAAVSKAEIEHGGSKHEAILAQIPACIFKALEDPATVPVATLPKVRLTQDPYYRTFLAINASAKPQATVSNDISTKVPETINFSTDVPKSTSMSKPSPNRNLNSLTHDQFSSKFMLVNSQKTPQDNASLTIKSEPKDDELSMGATMDHSSSKYSMFNISSEIPRSPSFASDSSSSLSDEDNTEIQYPSVDLLANLMPKISTTDKEIITISSNDASGGNLLVEKENHSRHMLNTIFLVEYLFHYVSRRNIKTLNLSFQDLTDFEQECPKHIAKVVHYYPGLTFEEKLEDFIRAFNFVFQIDDSLSVGIISTAQNFIDEAYTRLVKEMVVNCVNESKRAIEVISKYVRDMFVQEPFPHYATFSNEDLKGLVLKNESEFNMDHNQEVHVIESSRETNSNPNETRDITKQLVTFFQKEMSNMPAGAFYKMLPCLLCWKKPELLASLSNRSALNIFKILSANDSFEAQGYTLSLKSSKSVEPVLNVLSNSNAKSSPSKTAAIPKIASASEAATNESLCCVVGIIFTLDKCQGTVWCAPGSNSKTTFALVSLNTIVNNAILSDLGMSLKTGDKVVVSIASSCQSGLLKWNATKLRSSLGGKSVPCPVCEKPANINQANSPANFTNGIALDKHNTFFWNVVGNVLAKGDYFMTICCFLSKKSNRQRLNAFCDNTTLLLDTDGKKLEDFSMFSIHQQVECDIMLCSINSELLWTVTQVRKMPFDIQKMYTNDQLAFNCQGIVHYNQNGLGRLVVTKSQTNKKIANQVARYAQRNVWFVRTHFPEHNFENRLKPLDRIIFDAVLCKDSGGEFWQVHLIRKSFRPVPQMDISVFQQTTLTNSKEPAAIDLDEFYALEIKEVTNTLKKPFDLTSQLADTLPTTFYRSTRTSTATQTMSTGPIVTVTGLN